jgi:hypothetical protein
VTALERSRNNCTVIYRPVLSSERALQTYKPVNAKEISRRKRNWSQVPDGRLTPGQTDRLNVGRELTHSLTRPPLWSSGQSQEVRVRVSTLPDFLRSSGSGTGSSQLREYN